MISRHSISGHFKKGYIKSVVEKWHKTKAMMPELKIVDYAKNFGITGSTLRQWIGRYGGKK